MQNGFERPREDQPRRFRRRRCPQGPLPAILGLRADHNSTALRTSAAVVAWLALRKEACATRSHFGAGPQNLRGVVDNAPAIVGFHEAIATGSVRLCPVCDAYEIQGKRAGRSNIETSALPEGPLRAL
jgi:hypothetical protein